MKKQLIYPAIALVAVMGLFASCQKESDNGRSFTLLTTPYGGDDKTTMGTDGATMWEAGSDQIYINSNTTSATVSASEGEYSVEVPDGVERVNGHYYACYPGVASVSSFDNSNYAFTLTIPVNCTISNGQIHAPMMGIDDGSTLRFTNVCSLLKITFPAAVPGRTVTITETGSGAMPLTGDFTYTYGIGWTNTSQTNTGTTLTITTDAAAIYVPLPAGNHQLSISGDQFVTNSMNTVVTMAPGVIYPITMKPYVFPVSNTQKVRMSPGFLYKQGDTYKFDGQIQYNLTNTTSGTYSNSSSATNGQYKCYFTWTEAMNGGSDNNPGSFTVEGYGSGWKLLTQTQGQYIVDHCKHAHVTINGVNGLILAPEGCNATIQGASGITWNTGTTSQTFHNCTNWEALKSVGCVFLPASGKIESGTTLTETGTEGYPWTATQYKSTTSAYNFYFYSNYLIITYGTKTHRRSVELVQFVD